MTKSAPTYLIADLHLQDERPETTQLFLDFLDGPAREAASLYIMGDLFEVWIGDDAPGNLGRRVARQLAKLAEGGTALFFICGNRDFLVGDQFCRQSGMTRLEEPVFLTQDNEPILLLHGDTLCTDDESYQRFRRKARDPRWQQRILGKPAWLRKLMARLARWKSLRHTASTEESIMDVNFEAVEAAFREHGVRRMIHGHTHRLAIHDISVDQRHCQRIVLGDWHETGSTVRVDSGVTMMTVARNDDGSVELRLQETAAPLS
ncbi:UDP-2,3-diacylglucosamine diphosphatase [Wenzhouxiangella sp. 15190]|uniref:UDP-2,3-diacylglucosamine diphosphatase n=1 Tax=unclassified Wenzhouxiangella TaxID=2613841 RepID=UPI002868C17C|nr:UDP-2,3-diacylglucosamine diphosphatase [Wenzhouxiangella sp. 15190]